ncbi:MAG: hypothetical protein ACM33B_12330 [Pseudomonadota bacterium]
MSTLGLLAMGVLVTLVVGSGLALLVVGAILDGRDEAQRKDAEAEHALASAPGNGAGPRSTVIAIDVRAADRSRPNRRDT